LREAGLSSAAPSDAFAFEELTPPPTSRVRLGVNEVTARAQAMLEAAEAQAGRIQEEARAAGYAHGLEEGRAAAQAELRPAAEALAAALDAARQIELGMADHVEAEACRFALAVAEKVVAGAIDAQPERVLDVIRAALRVMVERERVVIQVNPAELPLVRESLEDLRGILGGLEHVELHEERRVGRGGAIVRTNVGEVDARLDAKLEQLRGVLAAELAVS